MSKHTPGPWEITEDDYGDEHWFGGDGNGQIQVNEWVNGGCKRSPEMWERLQEEARLIAAAPELLEAVTKALHALNAVHIQCDVACVVEPEGEIYLRPVINALHQVIAKATGEQA